MEDGFGYVDATDIMREWVMLGDGEDNPYMRFMAYWVAFNMLYAPYQRGRRDVSDREAILQYFAENEACLSEYDPFSNGDADLFSSLKLFELYNWPERRINRERDDIEGGDVEALMKAVYKVRCNFFHGNKRLGNPTDREFVDCSAKIIRGYLGTLGFIPNETG